MAETSMIHLITSIIIIPPYNYLKCDKQLKDDAQVQLSIILCKYWATSGLQ